MSDATVTEVTEAKAQPIDKGNYQIHVDSFGDGDLAGFKYNFIQFKSSQGAVTHLGDDAVVKLINRAAKYGLQTKARNKLGKEDGESPEAYKARLAEEMEANGEVILTPEEAEGWKPGEREVSSISGITKKMTEALKEAKKAKDAGDLERRDKCIAEAKELRAQLDSLQEEEMLKLAA